MSEPFRWSEPAGAPRPPGPKLCPDPPALGVPEPGRLAESALARVLGSWAWPVTVYSASRLALLVVAGAVGIAQHRSLLSELSLFDGQWYLRLAHLGYPTHPSHGQTTLGFLPLYPLVIRALAWATSPSLALAALLTSLVGGLVAVVLIQRLTTSWWGEAAGRRAALLFSLFPGSIVFFMAYSECLTIPLALGCLLALRSERWGIAGLLAGLATAVEPVALVLIPVTTLAAARQLRLRGWRDGAARRSLVAPLLSPLGIGAFAVFLWVWTGTPFATLEAQRYGWHHPSVPIGVFGLPIVRHLLAHPGQLLGYVLTWNLWSDVAGGVFLACSLLALWRVRRELSSGALLYAAGAATLTLWLITPPNARMLLVAAPAVVVWARCLSPRRFWVFIGAEAVLFAFMSVLTLSGHMLP